MPCGYDDIFTTILVTAKVIKIDYNQSSVYNQSDEFSAPG
ncbi:hypothetical protein HMPREF9374_2451 [Desmospora sp. 8437]|nr:hypothetical protein HMPREF9374_2451 [Desmospora sp. 8437]